MPDAKLFLEPGLLYKAGSWKGHLAGKTLFHRCSKPSRNSSLHTCYIVSGFCEHISKAELLEGMVLAYHCYEEHTGNGILSGRRVASIWWEWDERVSWVALWTFWGLWILFPSCLKRESAKSDMYICPQTNGIKRSKWFFTFKLPSH